MTFQFTKAVTHSIKETFQVILVTKEGAVIKEALSIIKREFKGAFHVL